MTIVADVLALTDPVLDRGFRDIAPKGTELPYLVVWPDITPRRRLQTGDGQTRRWESTAQIDVWQTVTAEDDTLVPALVAALDGADGMQGRHGLRVQSVQRTIDRTSSDVELVHTLITLTAVEPR